MSRTKPKAEGDRAKIGLALAGGGPEGAVYEIGALRALEEVLDGVEFHRDVHAYVGVSAGAFIASCLANQMTTRQLCRSLFKEGIGENPLHPAILFRPALGELARRGVMAPGLLYDAVVEYVKNPRDQSLAESMTRLTRALPVGIFDNEPLRRFLEKTFSMKGRTDDFRKLGKNLFVVAADLDSGNAVRFGEPGHDHVPISKAIQASTALPGMYPPVEVDGRHYLDGVLLKTLHASYALEAGAEFLICINPLVPMDTVNSVRDGAMKKGRLANRGLPTVMAQTFRTLIHSRMTSVLDAYEEVYPGVDLVLLEPRRDDYRMFFTNIFSVNNRRTVCEHAYQSTRRQLWDRREELEPLFAANGIKLRTDLLADTSRTLWESVDYPSRPSETDVASGLDRALTRLENLLEKQAS